MSTLPTDLRTKLERTAIAARNLAEKAAKAALESLAVQSHEAYGHMTKEQKDLRNKLRAHARQLGDTQDAKGQLSINHLAQERAYEHWHRMLFARFLAENHLLIEPDMGVAVSLDECKELAKEAKTDLWALAGRFAQTMLPEIFRVDDPVLQVPLAREDQLKLEQLLDALPADVFTVSDSLGWCYQFWQTEQKETVNKSGSKIGADELPAVTQLFTEDYMVDFLLDNTLGAWHAARCAGVQSSRFKVSSCPTEEAARKVCALPGVEWKYLRFVKEAAGGEETWTPAAGTFDGWPKTAKQIKCLDPCMGSGHFVVAMFERLVALRMAEETLDEPTAVAAVIRDNLFGLEIDPRCTQIAAFNLALAAWRRVGHCALPAMNLACSGLAPNAKKDDWLKLTEGSPNLRFPMGALYDLFEKAPVLGSLINPRRDKAVTYFTTLHELQPLLEKALAQDKSGATVPVANPKESNRDDCSTYELAVTARGLVKAAEILAAQFALVATNVPYLGRGKQEDALKNYCESIHRDAKADLATCFVERCIEFCAASGTTVLVTPQNWFFLGTYKKLRQQLFNTTEWNFAVKLGPAAFQNMNFWAAKTALCALSRRAAGGSSLITGFDVSQTRNPSIKATLLLSSPSFAVPQLAQLKNPDARLLLSEMDDLPLLEKHGAAFQGIATADYSRFGRCFWELPDRSQEWQFQQSTVEATSYFSGREHIFLWEDGKGALAKNDQARIQGLEAVGKFGIAVSQMNRLPVTLFTGEFFDNNCSALVVREKALWPAVWAYCSSDQFLPDVREIDQAVKVTNASLVKIPFDLAHWQKVASEKYPQGLPKPFSSDPTQWLFNGHPVQSGATVPVAGTEQSKRDACTTLHVAVARLLGYEWPRQTGSSFPDCPALGPDGLEKLANDDGIVCLLSVRGAEPAADRLRKLLAAAFKGAATVPVAQFPETGNRDDCATFINNETGNRDDCSTFNELELIRASGSDAADLDDWLRNDFFQQHCDLFHQRPFLWHIWDGRKRDGFHALVNYHNLATEKGKGRRTLENLTHSYLGDWITRQRDSLKRGEEGADERLAAALALKERLEAIIEGEPPFDIFVRWKPLNKQAIGWEPDINDGVRMNIRPFLASDLPNGKKGAGILRSKPNIKWEKDRGNEPQRAKEDFPWFWRDDKFTGERLNDVHLAQEEKRKARKT